MERAAKFIGICIAILVLGALLGLGLANYFQKTIKTDLVAEEEQDVKERFELGQNAYKPPKVKARTSSYKNENANFELGKMKNGKRLLVPGEPALKKERETLVEQEAAVSDYLGISDAEQSDAISDYQSSLNPDGDLE